MILDGCGPANYTAWQNNFCLSFSRARPLRAVDPVFCTNRRNYLREKIAKNAALSPALPAYPRSPHKPPRCCLPRPGLFLSRLLLILSSAKVPLLRKRIRIMIRHFAGISARLVTHRLLVQILPDTGYKSDGNDFGQEC